MDRRSALIGGGTAILVAAGAGAMLWRRAVGSMATYEVYQDRLRAGIGQQAELAELIRYGTLAANSHNTQPWLFGIGENAIDILPDFSRATPVVDPDDHHLFVSLGCAAENLAIAARASGRPGEIVVEPEGESAVRFAFSSGSPAPGPLFEAITRRQSTRTLYDGQSVPAADLAALERAAAEPGTKMILVTDRGQMDRIGDLIVAGNDRQMTDRAFMAELKQWLRFNPASAMASGDGLFSPTTGNPVLPDFAGPMAVDLFLNAASENDRYARQIASSAGLAVFVGERADRAHWIGIGRACQRFALAATSLGLKHAFVNQPVEVAELRPELAGLIGEQDKRPDLVIRFGYGPQMPFSPRRPVTAVLA